MNMAAKHMKIQRIVLPFLTVAILASQLAGCAMLSKEDLLDNLNEGSDVVIEYAEPDRDKAGIEENIDFDTPTTTPDSTNNIQVDSETTTIRTELTGENLISVFQDIYDKSNFIGIGVPNMAGK